MFVDSLELINFRNYSNLSISLNRGLNIFIGENAQGKTNIAEAIYYLSNLKSHRTSRDKELIQWNKSKAYIKGNVKRNLGDITIEFLIDNEDKKACKINGLKTNKTAEILGSAVVVIFSPEDLKIVKEGPNFRRRFIDNELNQIRPRYHNALVTYNRVLMQRNALLKSIKYNPSLRTTAEVFGEQLAEHGSYIIDTRIEFVKKLSLTSKLLHRKITDSQEDFSVTYQNSAGEYRDRKQLKDELVRIYTENMDEDIEKGYTLKGPHRDDLLIEINGKDVKVFGSQGQQRTAALSLKLSELEIIKSEIGEYPVLILDDVMSELDVKRQKFLLGALKDIQTILTCTSMNDINSFHFEEKDVFHVEKGTVKKD